ncbi:MAG: hypothetical protein KAT93_00815 [Desulfuromonadales bacterium]|nr:hypothetical protein [Desulfuromonadales bacterium]
MLIYESEGWLEVEDQEIAQLCRSTKSIALASPSEGQFTLTATLCLHRAGLSHLAQAAFYCRNLKKTLLFTVQGHSGTEAMQRGLDELNDFGFQMEAVNLNLSPALRQVVLRDIPGVQRPDQARKQHNERMALLAEMEEAYQEDPQSPAGKKAKRKLDAERRLNERAVALRDALIDAFVPKDEVKTAGQSPGDTNEALAERLARTEAAFNEEQARHKKTEEILAAAEKRIQELEETLVNVDTKISTNLKHKQKMMQLEARIKSLTDELNTANTRFKEGEEALRQQVKETRSIEGRVTSAESQLAARTVELEKSFEQLEQEKSAKEELVAELEKGRALLEETRAAKTGLEQELTETGSMMTTLQKDLEMAEENAMDKSRGDERIAEFRRRLETLEISQKEATAEIEQEHSVRKRLEKGAAADEKRITELEKALAEAEKGLSGVANEAAQRPVSEEVSRLQEDLQKTMNQFEAEAEIRSELEKDFEEAHKIIEALEKALKESGKNQRKKATPKTPGATHQEDSDLAEKLRVAESQLEQELIEQKKNTSALAVAQKRICELEEALQQTQEAAKGFTAKTEGNQGAVSQKPLPHELRPAPTKGVLFHPDWDLEGLPCKSADQVVQAWESVFNVQLSLEGYPAQYCTAFLVIIKTGKINKIFMLFRLKKNNHTLVCVPTKPPADDAAMKKCVKAGKRYLQLSGFELEKLASENVPGMLGTYFLDD